jgi:hypothetical protein
MVDWNEVTAIATGVLAVSVPPTLYFTKCAYETAKADLVATSKAASDQLKAEHRPLLIDITPTAPPAVDLDGGEGVTLDFPGWHTTGDGRYVCIGVRQGRVFFAVPLRNVGRGLAVIDPKEITVEGDRIAQHSLGCEVQRERVPSGEMTRILCTYESAARGETPNVYEMRVPYSDLDESQSFEVRVHLERESGDNWHVRDVKQLKLTSTSE